MTAPSGGGTMLGGAVTVARRRGAPRCRSVGAPGFSDRLGEGSEVVVIRLGGSESTHVSDDLPVPGHGQAHSVALAQVVGVRFVIGGQGTDDRSRVGVDVGQGGDSRTGTPGSRTPPR